MVDRVYIERKDIKGGTGTQKKGVRGRSMVLTKKTKKALSALVSALDKQGYTEPDDYLFQTQRSGNHALNPNGFWRAMKDAKLALGFTGKIATHSMRKTFADRVYTELLTHDGCDAMRTLGKALGHENLNNTDKYLSFREDELVGAINKVFE
jgi:site-specific recombinase XerD